MSSKIGNLLAAFGLEQPSRRRTKSAAERKLRVEQLENRSLLAAVANLVAFRPVTEYIDYSSHPVAEAVEADLARGPGIRANGDYDNKATQPDFNVKTATVSADNDLVRVDVTGAG